ncbi:hypothetical protein DSO57_1002387 [Entomophthora muscae]|uniref:Uncharacterized protein n=1 Tax=Entomophthora muscae TaxID=34485 RepID=A0ACC2RNK8_9FUNG|nr:hypothetical protein DSO57_1002387 [Entomophthora muscae]
MSGGVLFQSLAPNNMDYSLTQELPPHYLVADHLSSPLENSSPLRVVPSVSCTPWLLAGTFLMAANTYFPAVTPTLSLWAPVRAFIPVLQWMASWWIFSPGWDPNLASLASLSRSIREHEVFNISGAL